MSHFVLLILEWKFFCTELEKRCLKPIRASCTDFFNLTKLQNVRDVSMNNHTNSHNKENARAKKKVRKTRRWIGEGVVILDTRQHTGYSRTNVSVAYLGYSRSPWEPFEGASKDSVILLSTRRKKKRNWEKPTRRLNIKSRSYVFQFSHDANSK